MAEDDSENADEGEKQDVKAKLAKMSGTRLRKERAVRAAEKKAIATDAGEPQEKGDPKELERAAKKAREIKEMLAAEPSDPVETDGDDDAARPEPEPAKKRKRKETPYPGEADEDASVAAPVGFVLGLVGGCLPAIVTLAMAALGSTAPEGLPADAVERQHDWVHCGKAVSTNRWACDVYDYSGNQIGKGEFVPAVDSKGSDWRILAAQNGLTIDGEYENLLAQSQMVYVKGVAVSSKRLWGKK